MTIDNRPLLRAIFDAAVKAAHPEAILAQHLPPPPAGRIVVLAAGKAAGAMAASAERHYLDTLKIAPERFGGIATTRHGHGRPTRRIRVVEAGHPVPDQAGLQAAADSLALAATVTEDDLLLVLLSGGGSANWIAPAHGVGFAQKQALTRALLRCGAPIGEINTVRKHLSRIKGGRLARAGHRAAIVTLASSDVPHDDAAVIASGPTVPDPTTLADARAIVAKYDLAPDTAIGDALDDAENESVKPGDPAFARTRYTIIARPRDALDAAVTVARAAGYTIIDKGADCEGEAREIAAEHAALARHAYRTGQRVAILSGGEMTVTVGGRGRGGPNQEYALALLQELDDLQGISALAADTDGADGGGGDADDPAGAIVDARTVAAMRAQRRVPAAYLADNDATGFFEKVGGLIVCGPTMTNVNDIRVILVDPN